VNAVIERLQRASAADRGVIALGGALPSPAQFPLRSLRAALRRAVDGTALQYAWPEGLDALRDFVRERLAARGVALEASDVIVTSGAQQAIAIAVELAARRGQRIAVGAESYPAALDLFRTRGLKLVAGGAATARYVMPEVSNPHGVQLSDDERTRLLDAGGFLVEDDAYCDLRFDGPAGRPLCADARDRVFHVGTFSKSLCPGLRVGWLVAPPRLRARALRRKRDRDLQAPTLTQALLAGWLASHDFDAHLSRLRRFYRRRAERLAEAMARELPSFRFTFPVGGFSFFCEADATGDDARFLEIALEHGVAFDPGQLFRVDGRARRPLALRLCFSLVAERDLDEGVRRLARAWAAFHRSAKVARHAPRSPRVVGRRVPPRVRAVRARSRPGGAAVDPVEPAVGVASARRRADRRLQVGARRGAGRAR
jgi:2-aminoadipate transaminase